MLELAFQGAGWTPQVFWASSFTELSIALAVRLRAAAPAAPYMSEEASAAALDGMVAYFDAKRRQSRQRSADA